MRELTTGPPDSHGEMRCGELFKCLRDALGLSIPEVADAIAEAVATCRPEANGVDEETVKGWGARNAVPSDRLLVKALIDSAKPSPKIAEAWWSALDAAWDREQRAKEREQAEKRSDKAFIDALRKRVASDRTLTRLPALFDTDRTLPLATAYVDLLVMPAAPLAPAPHLLEQRQTLSEIIRRRSEQRRATRRSPKDALDHEGTRCRLILGAPGSGKSSLLRRLALDIAAGKWKSAALPLFVEARDYAAKRRLDPTLSLIGYACRIWSAPHGDASRLHDLLTAPDVDGARRAVLLVDGLDEIASDKDAVAAVYGTLADSSNGVAWIATARPAGLVQALHEDQRFDLAALDEQAVATLIDNWCKASTAAGLALDAEALKIELDRVPGIREMATSPFLLTALCFLKTTAPGADLPNSRIGVYESLLQRIAAQAQARHRDPAILSPDVQRDLADFACYLYCRPSGAIQVFPAAMWREFTAATPRAERTDFADHVVPARLLTVWHEADPQYHFLHLTMQEHLVARAMLAWDIDDALTYRFHPAWRAVFRFYGALLWHSGKAQPFAALTSALYQSRDISDLTLITLAEIFADAGLRDTRRQLGTDLRDRLWDAAAATSDHAVGQEAFITALAALDPDWLAARTIADADYLIAVASKCAAVLEGDGHYDGHLPTLTGRGFGSPYMRLARARTPQARQEIEDAFCGKDQDRALMAATAYAGIASPERTRIVAALAMEKPDWSLRAYAFAYAKRSAEFLPFLGQLTQHFAETGDDPFSEAMHLIADIGGPVARTLLRKRLLFELRRHARARRQRGQADHIEGQIQLCARAVARLGGQDAYGILDEAALRTDDEEQRRNLRILRLAITPGSGPALIAFLDDLDASGVVLTALADAASFGRLPDDRLVKAIAERAAEELMSDAFNLAVLERARLDAGAPPLLCGSLLGIAGGMLESLRSAKPGSAAQQGMTTDLSLILDALARGRWAPALPLITTIMDDANLPTALVEAAVTAAGLVLQHDDEQAVSSRADRMPFDQTLPNRLEEMLFDEACKVDPYEITLAIGRIRLERLFQLRGANTASSTLQQIAAEQDLLILEDRWVDRAGVITTWTEPPRQVLYHALDKHRTLCGLFSHELSRWKLFMTTDCRPDCCAAMLVFGSLHAHHPDVQGSEMAAVKREGHEVFRIPANMRRAEARKRARQIAEKITGRSL